MAVKQVIVVRRDVRMKRGQLAAQVAHASMLFLTRNNAAVNLGELHVALSEWESEWIISSSTKVVVGVDSEQELLDVVSLAMRDGIETYTCHDTGPDGQRILTCAALGPDDESALDPITGKLKLL